MKELFFLLVFFISFTGYSQAENVSIVHFPAALNSGQELTFSIQTKSDLKAEIAIFADTYLGYQAQAVLNAGQHTYAIPTKDWPAGKYYILLKNEELHVQHDFILNAK